MNAIEIKHLTKNYGTARGIIDVNFEVKEGEIFGFIGPNGAGKSTTIRTLLGLIHPTEGSATIFGKDITTSGPDIRKEIGYLPSEVFYYDNMKVIDLLNYSASFYDKDCRKRIKELASEMDLDLNKKIEDLSFGNKKKVGIVQGLLHEPKLIILDEPTSGLDPLMQQKFFDLIDKENKKGATVLLSSHILSEVQRLCDRVAIIKEGKIIKIDTISSLKKDNYKKIKVEISSKVSNKFFNIEGITNLKENGNVYNFLFKGDIDELIKHLAKEKVVNFWAEDPDLEEIFMHFYEKGN